MDVKKEYFRLKELWIKSSSSERDEAERKLNAFFESLGEEEKELVIPNHRKGITLKEKSNNCILFLLFYFTKKESFSRSLSSEDAPTITMNSPGSTIFFIFLS